MMFYPAIVIRTTDARYVVHATSTSTYTVERYNGFELTDIWEAESFSALGEIMDFLTGEDEDWDKVFASIEG